MAVKLPFFAYIAEHVLVLLCTFLSVSMVSLKGSGSPIRICINELGGKKKKKGMRQSLPFLAPGPCDTQDPALFPNR